MRARRGWQCPGKPAAGVVAVLERRRRAEAVAGFKDGAADAGEGARRELADCGDEAGDADGPGVMTYSSSPEEGQGAAAGGVSPAGGKGTASSSGGSVPPSRRRKERRQLKEITWARGDTSTLVFAFARDFRWFGFSLEVSVL